MITHVNLLKGLKTYLCLLALTLNFAAFSLANSETITTIILIDRVAELVELTEDGEVLQRHLAVPDYFTSGRSHSKSLRQSLAKLKDYGLEESFELPGSSDLSSTELQTQMTSYITKSCSLAPMNILPDSLSTMLKTKSNQRAIQHQSHVKYIATIQSEPDLVRTTRHLEQRALFVDVFYPRLEDSQPKQRDFHLVRSYNSDIAQAYI